MKVGRVCVTYLLMCAQEEEGLICVMCINVCTGGGGLICAMCIDVCTGGGGAYVLCVLMCAREEESLYVLCVLMCAREEGLICVMCIDVLYYSIRGIFQGSYISRITPYPCGAPLFLNRISIVFNIYITGQYVLSGD